jgi:RNA polymerase sigma-70 factor (ECF subfamily)
VTAAARLPAPAPADGDLLAAVANGNLEALGELFERHEPEVRRYVGRLGVAPSDVDDLVQATFLEVVRAAARFDPRHAARSWLFGIATVMVRRHRRSVGRAMARIAAWAGTWRGEPQPTPAELLESDEATRLIERAFERLSPKKREVLVLVTLEGLSGEEAARALRIPMNTVWTRLHHARIELRAALGEGDR